MANNIAAETPVNNDAILWCEVEKDSVHPTTGEIETAPVIGASDIIAFFSATKELSDAASIHEDLEFTLSNVSATNRYFAYPTGDTLRERLLPTYKDQSVYVHFIKGTIGGSITWHEVASTIITDERPAL